MLYGKGFRAPSPTSETYNTFGSFNGATDDEGQYLGTGFRVPNPALKPERINAYEMALLHQFNSHIDFSLRTYRYDASQLISVVPVAEPVQFIPGAFLSNGTMRANLGDSVHRGLDVGLDARHTLGGAWRASYWAYYSYVSGYTTYGGQREALLFTTPHKVKLGTTFHFRDNYYITARMQASKAVTSSLPVGQGRYGEAPGFAVMDLRFGLAQSDSRRWHTALEINNLFDTRYYHAVVDNSAGRGYADASQPGRNINLVVQYDWN
jgi:outer membrane receptor protein involved in Fe transport